MTNKTKYIGPSSYEPPLRNVTSLPRIVRAQVASAIRRDGFDRMMPKFVTSQGFGESAALWCEILGVDPAVSRGHRNFTPQDISELGTPLRRSIHRIRGSPRLLWSCIHASDLPWPRP